MSEGADDQIHPVVNVEEVIGKTVGRRGPPRGLPVDQSRKRMLMHNHEAMGGVGIPRGVYKFESHEAADKWMIQQLAQAAAKRS